MGTDSKVPLAHRLKRSHLLDVVWVEVLKLQPVLEQHPADEPPAGTEKPRSWKATNNTTYPLGVRHGLVAGDSPLVGGSERRKLSCLDKTEELLAGNVGARPVRHHDGGVLDGLEEQAAAVLRMRKNLECRGQA
jgi:hypothetical protein